MRPTLAVIPALVLFSVVNASQPGQPLDCSDWQFLAPGFSCTTVFPIGCDSTPNAAACVGPSDVAQVDNLGQLLRFRTVFIGQDWEVCPGFPYEGVEFYRIELVRYGGATPEVLAFIDPRCGSASFAPTIDVLEAQRYNVAPTIAFDHTNGRLLIGLRSYCHYNPSQPGGCQYAGGTWLAALTGFASMFEILQSFAPTPMGVSFTVPVHPEGMQAVGHFDTYYGPLLGPRDFSEAQPLRCNYPATIPRPGDYLEAGIVPDPPARQGYYYVTAATYQGETRYGRKRENGVLSGRDPAGLPPCALAAAPSVASLR